MHFLPVVSENWKSQCVRLKVTVKADNCGESQNCSGKGVCYTNVSMVSNMFVFLLVNINDININAVHL